MSVYQSGPDPGSAAPAVAPAAAPAASASAAAGTLPMHTPLGTCSSWWILVVPLCQKLCQKPMELIVRYVSVLLEGRVEVLVYVGGDYDLRVVCTIVRAESHQSLQVTEASSSLEKQWQIVPSWSVLAWVTYCLRVGDIW